jgi:osmotically-inducible protein OsmY
MKSKFLISALAGMAVLGALGGCSQAAQEKYDAAGDAAAKAADKTGEAVATDAQKTGEAVGQAAENAGEAVEAAGEKAAQVGDNATTTLAVKNALLSAKDLKVADLNVDTEGNTITLKGSVPTADEKSRAETLAKSAAGKDFTVKNELSVGPMGSGSTK